MLVLGINAILDEAHPPFNLWVNQGALHQHPVSIAIIKPFKAPFAIGIAEEREIGALRGSRWTGGEQGWVIIRRAVAIFAADFDGIGNFPINKSVAMAILRKVAIGALQPFFRVNIHHMDRFSGIGAGLYELAFSGLAEFLGIVGVNDMRGFGAVGRLLALCIEQIAFTVTLEDRAEIPAVSVIVGELRVFQARIQIIHIAQEINIFP